MRIDGQIYFFGFSYGGDLVVSPLHADAESMATYAAAHLRQRDGRKDQAFWLTQAQESLQESGLSDRAGTMLDLHRLRRDLAGLRRDRATVRALPGLEVPSHLIYLLEANCAWPAEEWPAGLAASAKRLGLDLDDTSGWLEGATAILAGDVAIPRGANFSDAASVYLWYLDRLLLHQRHDWSKELKLGDAEWHG
ncbi:MAG: hypothetical protein J7507_14580 [Pseudoxanthomonas sp.]|nr:hypothetical protein [Pseudoxanthomonas sp.]